MIGPFRYLRLGPGARWPKGRDGRRLRRKLRHVGQDLGQVVVITSGLRTPFEQWRAYQDHLRGGTLAAPCCTRHYPHDWPDCLRQCASNHCRSKAADCVVEAARSGELVNIGEVPGARKAMARHGLCLPVGSGETWHVEIGNTWRS